ncbi:phosphatase PAP2 family protein [Oceanobacillus longus]|uniref:Phosphatase PAP2 family protein n=1 Tax=Oceanobacillus longus TaxID=930120 RepID=A0ABV8GRK7_9BACI
MEKLFAHFYTVECKLFKYINQFFERRHLNLFLRTITHLGDAKWTISILLLFILFSSSSIQLTAIASAISLTISHIPVALAKKLFPRRRPYLALPQIDVTDNPLKDHSFPSGHTTAIFSIVTPFILLNPIWTIILVPIAILVGISRIYLGLHYPSDVVVGCLIGWSAGTISYAFMVSNFTNMFL